MFELPPPPEVCTGPISRKPVDDPPGNTPGKPASLQAVPPPAVELSEKSLLLVNGLAESATSFSPAEKLLRLPEVFDP